VTLAESRAGRLSRWRRRSHQVRAAKSFLQGEGVVPTLPGISGSATFESVGRIRLQETDSEAIADLLDRYLLARLLGQSVFGAGYYGWPAVSGWGALWLSVAVAGWLARLRAASEGRVTLTSADAGLALGVVDRAATRLPALGTFAERTRLAYLFRDDGLARLIHEFAPVSKKSE
jgi:hypothetical protein